MDPLVAQKIEEFFSGYAPRRYDEGQILISAHDNPEYVYHLVKGRVKQYDISDRGDEVILNVFKPPAFFPMSNAINQTPNLYFYETESEVELRQAPPSAVVDFLKSNPDVLFNLLSRVYMGTDGLLGRLARLMAGTARSRILYELLIECRRFGQPRGTRIAIALTESDIAARAGLTRETVSREIRKLKQDDLISIIKNEIFVNNIDRLAQEVGR
jgi:CRP-like cAMP-binding protein